MLTTIVWGLLSTTSMAQSDGPVPTPKEQLETSAKLNPGEYVVQLRVHECRNTASGGIRSLTGFFVSGKNGIITALHGVADCQRETVEQDCLAITVTESLQQKTKNQRRFRDYRCLQIIETDITRDLVHLNSIELVYDRNTHYWPNDGLEPAYTFQSFEEWPCTSTHEEQVRVYGFPGLSETSRKRVTTANCVSALIDLLSDESLVSIDQLASLKIRNSPSHTTTVLYIQESSIRPGDSGAPVLITENNRLLGVVLGGIPGSSGIVWASPWPAIDWKSALNSDTRNQLAKLKTLSLDVERPKGFFDLFWGFPGGNGPTGIRDGIPAIYVRPYPVWPENISAEVYSPVDACIVILTDDFYSGKHVEITEQFISANTSLVSRTVGMRRQQGTSSQEYREFCNKAANNDQVTLYAYLFANVGNVCARPLPTENDLAYSKFELGTGTHVWTTGFCADDDIQSSFYFAPPHIK